MIEAIGLTKNYGDRVAVNDLTFTVQPGQVTGFLGPNGAGKSTTMRMILGLDRPSAGTVTVNGHPYVDIPAPLSQVGALLEAKAVHTARSACNHLRWLAATEGIPASRVREVIDLVGLGEVASKPAGSFSLGMGQRLGIASALLGDPEVIILDEPVNGLDPEGVRWVRRLLRDLADQGRTVMLSSHLMSEMELIADHVLIVGKGRLISDTSMDELRSAGTVERVVVRSPEVEALWRLLAGPGITISSPHRQSVEVTGASAEAIGTVASKHGIPLYELTPRRESLEDIFMRLTAGSVEYHAGSLDMEVAA